MGQKLWRQDFERLKSYQNRFYEKYLCLISNGASPVPPASESRLWRIEFGNWNLLARKLWFGGSFLDEKVIRNRSWAGFWKVWGGSWEVFGRLPVFGWCLGLDRFLEALGRIWESKWCEFWSNIEEKTTENSDRILVSMFDSFLIFFQGSGP